MLLAEEGGVVLTCQAWTCPAGDEVAVKTESKPNFNEKAQKDAKVPKKSKQTTVSPMR
jgi:hypothetical protein